MRIDGIRITSLASLHGAQTAIDLSGPLLGGAGLIAITGPTGAGKSTILDGLSLALFGCTPRLRKDTDHLLSRDAIAGGAEVALTLDDGSAWVVSWQAHRKHRRLDEEVQPPAQQVAGAADGAVVASGAKEVRAWIERHLRLTFDQFRGVMLLAQFDFARFLRADDGERSLLLEKLTGTGLYARLSAAAFARARQAQDEVQSHQLELAALTLLTPAERAQGEAGLADAGTVLAGAEAAWLQAQAGAAWWRERLRRQDEVGARRAAAAAAQLAWEAASAERARLALVEAASAFQAPALRLDGLRTQRESAHGERARSEAAAQTARGALAAHTARLQQAAADLDAAERAAAVAAAPVATLAQLADAPLQAARAAAVQLRERASRHQALRAQQPQREAALAQAGARLEAARTAHQAADTNQRQALATVAAAQTRLDAALAGGDAQALGAQAADAQAGQALAEHLAALQPAAAAEAAGVAAAAAEAAAHRRQDRAAALALAHAQLALAEAHRRHAGELAGIAAFAPLLQPGAPCPLCGSAAHPHPAQAGDHLLRAAGLQEADARRQVQQADQQLAQAGAALEQARTEAHRLQAVAHELGVSVRRLHDDWRRLRGRLAELPAAPEIAAAAVLRDRLEQRGAAARLAGQELEQALERRRLADHALAGALLAVGAGEAGRQQVAQALDELGAALAADAGQVAAAEAALGAAMADLAHALGEALPVVPAAWLEALPARIATARALVERARALAEAGHELGDEVRRLLPAGTTLVPAATAADQPARLLIATLRAALAGQRDATTTLAQRLEQVAGASAAVTALAAALAAQEAHLAEALAGTPFADEAALRAALVPAPQAQALRLQVQQLQHRRDAAHQEAARAADALAGHAVPDGLRDDQADGAALADTALQAAQSARDAAREDVARRRLQLAEDDERQHQRARILAAAGPLLAGAARAQQLSELIGSRDGARFRRFAQALTLDQLLLLANHRLAALAPRYLLARVPLLVGQDPSLELEVIDQDQAEARRPVATLSGGETFLVSLALALALADLKRGGLQLGTLFIDEGFGSLDPATLERCLAILERLQQEQGTQIIVISHIGALHERLAHRIEVRPQGNGRSRLRITSPEGVLEEVVTVAAAPADEIDAEPLWQALPVDGTPLSSRALRQRLGWDEAAFKAATASLLAAGRIAQPPGSKSLQRSAAG